jgi:hypothetical protein
MGDVSSFHTYQMLPNMHSLFQETLDIVSQALPAQVTARLPLNEVVALANVSDNNFERAIVSRHHSLLKCAYRACRLSRKKIARAVCERL